ncbi:MAG: hypothetical protein K940chlam8_00573 [Chlamydiae bacterium]|nr:hypothetical protein [Chlamydiota bacterium]
MASYLTTATSAAGAAYQNRQLIASARQASQSVGKVAKWASGSALQEMAAEKALKVCHYQGSRVQDVSTTVVQKVVKLSLGMVYRQTAGRVIKSKLEGINRLAIRKFGTTSSRLSRDHIRSSE